MINIAVVDDNEHSCEQTRLFVESCIDDENMINTIIKENKLKDLEIYVYKFSNANDFMAMGENKRFHILLSDIEMPEINGIDLGMWFREKYPTSCLIYLTSYSEYASIGFKMNVFQYIEKEDMHERMPAILWKAIRRMAKTQICKIEVTTQLGPCFISSSDVFYIQKEKNTKYVEYITQTGKYRNRITLEQAVQQMPKYEFIKVERGYAVNIRHVLRFRKNVILMRDKTEITVSRLYVAEFRKKLSEYGREL